MRWDASLLERSPMLAPLRAYAAPLAMARAWPTRGLLQQLVSERDVRTARGAALRLIAPQRRQRDAAGAARHLPDRVRAHYEARIFEDGEMQVREGDWHDLFNVLAWLAYPRTKAALNRLHCKAARAESPVGCAAPVRGRMRDALTLLDENGALVISSAPELLAALRAFRWKELFWVRRRRLEEALRVHIFGHALAEKALAPYVGMSAHAWLLEVPAARFGACAEDCAALDALAAERIGAAGARLTPRALAPLPVLGVPGWWPDNESELFYENEAYFRSGRRRRARPAENA